MVTLNTIFIALGFMAMHHVGANIARIDEFIHSILNCTDIPGISLSIVKDEQVYLTRGYGIKNLETGEQVTEDTMFVIASLTKAFLSTTMAKTFEDHPGMSLSSKVKDEIPGYYFSDPIRTEEATISDLLSHRMEYRGHNIMRIAGFSLEELTERIKFLWPSRSFREGMNYNNLMYALASYVIQNRYHEPWENIAREKIFSPLGMDNTTFANMVGDRWGEFARSYSWNDGTLREIYLEFLESFWYYSSTAPGGVAINAVDMAKWLNFQISYGKTPDGTTLVNEDMMKEMHKPSNVEPSSSRIVKPNYEASRSAERVAQGWFEGYYNGYRLHTHSGGVAGFTSLISLLPDINIGIYLAANGPVPSYGHEYIHMYITDLLMGQEPWIDLSYFCPNNAIKHQENIEKEHQEKIQSHQSKSPASRKVSIEGTFGNFAYGNLTVFLNDTTSRYNMLYGKKALFVMEEQEPGVYIARGVEPLWQYYYTMRYQNVDGIDQVTVEFEFVQPPTFIRDLKQADAPPPPSWCPDLEPTVPPTASDATVAASSRCFLFSVFIAFRLLAL